MKQGQKALEQLLSEAIVFFYPINYFIIVFVNEICMLQFFVAIWQQSYLEFKED